ncbi:SIS domain-containing protein [Rhodobacteraceae bacterium 2CG4]|uniref:SIS domain-containing protein n=1 Tax=Halovulum marinum TaxID=2662447 RepID=A0A6L5YXX9_9RHOB|nr:SIS domain-containing protein [Halovulum marinum]MSU88849.1 SIS domain-containing protein [Halovulum marinum]
MTATTMMRREIDEIPAAAARLLDAAPQDRFRAVGRALGRIGPRAVVTVARGSSDHAATCLKYAIELSAGVPVSSVGPSVASIYGAALHLDRVVALGVSQSGRSGDLVALMRACRQGGAQTLTLTNSVDSPLAGAAATVLDLCAGPEHAVAATKSFTNSVLSGLWLLAYWRGDDGLQAALRAAPDRLQDALALTAAPLREELTRTDRLVVIARGPGLGIAAEVALKAMELCGIHASAHSSAEVLHGPSAILRDGFPVLALGEPAEAGLQDTIDRLEGQGARVLTAPAVTPLHRFLDPLLQLAPVYGALEAAARIRGRNPDRPEFLAKETLTV